MPITLEYEYFEQDGSRSINITKDSISQKFQFILRGNFRAWAVDHGYTSGGFGPDDDLGMIKAVWLFIPDFRLVPLKDNSDAMLLGNVIDLTMVTPDVWKVDVEYATPSGDGRSPGGDSQLDSNPDYETWSQRFVQVSLTASTEEETKTLSRSLLAYHYNTTLTGTPVYQLNKPAPMGVTEDGVEGAPVYSRQLEFNMTTYLTPQEATLAYNRTLYRMAGTVNAGTFFGFPALSVIFLTGNANMDNPYSLIPVELSFKMRPNFKFSQTGPTVLASPLQDDPALMFDVYYDPWFPTTVAGPAPGNAYSGWNYVEYLYKKSAPSGAIMTQQTPVQRLIHNNYESSDFRYLGVGGGPPTP